MTAMLLGSNSLSRLRVLMPLVPSFVVALRSPLAGPPVLLYAARGLRFILARRLDEKENRPSPAHTDGTGVCALAGAETDRRRVADLEVSP